MGRTPPVRVALDLETTGLQVEQDAILEVAAIKFQGSQVLDRLETLVAPDKSIPYRVQRLTGITPRQLIGAPSFDTIAKKLQQFIGDFPIVGHSIPFDVSFLRRRGLARTNQLIDTFELAAVLLPSLSSYSLGHVALALGVPVAPARHRAMVDTELAMQVFLALHERLHALDLAALEELARLDAPRSWPLLAFFRQELRERQNQDGLRPGASRGILGERFAAQLGMDPRILSFAVAREAPAEEEDPAALATADSGEQFPPRAERADPSLVEGFQKAQHAVHEALEQRHPLVIEVTLGANEYAPVLLPALRWLLEPTEEATPRRLLIAVAGAHNARRLVETVLPRLQERLGSRLPVAYLAGRGGYLCLHRWFGAAQYRTSGEMTSEQARGLAKLGLWAQQTRTGERSELTLLPQEISAWERIGSGVERLAASGRSASAAERCVYHRKGYCFAGRAAERARTARIVVTTHVGLLDELSSSTSVLDDIEQRLILDADLLEDECARWSSQELNYTRLLELLNTVGCELPNGRFQGLLALAAPTLRENGPGGLSTTPTIQRSELDQRLLSRFQALRHACSAAENLFAALSRLLEEAQRNGNGNGQRGKGDTAGRNHGGRGTERLDQPLRLTPQVRGLESWSDVERAWQQLAQRLRVVIDLLRGDENTLSTSQRHRHRLDTAGGGVEDMLASEFALCAERLLELWRGGQQAFSFQENDTVYWLRMPSASAQAQQRLADASHAGENFPVLYGQLMQAAPLLKRLLLTERTNTIFAGTALSVGGNFSFYHSRLGLEQEQYPSLSIANEHHEQTLLYIPDDVPEPNTPQYQRHLDSAIMQLAEALEGQLVVLFTSHAALRSSYSFVKNALEEKQILLLGHGIDGSPRLLWQNFAEQERVVLFGTGSFWDGVEEVSRPPACICIARLPMPVLNDPPLAARAEQYSDQLHQFTVPTAALRLRRALNRLAWSGTRRNAVVFFDRRVVSKEYGSLILHSLPRAYQRSGSVSHMPETILDWLTSDGAWE